MPTAPQMEWTVVAGKSAQAHSSELSLNTVASAAAYSRAVRARKRVLYPVSDKSGLVVRKRVPERGQAWTHPSSATWFLPSARSQTKVCIQSSVVCNARYKKNVTEVHPLDFQQ